MTTGEQLVLVSSLSTGTAEQHLLNIVGTGGGDIFYITREPLDGTVQKTNFISGEVQKINLLEGKVQKIELIKGITKKELPLYGKIKKEDNIKGETKCQ